MPVVSSYTETEFADYLRSVLGQAADTIDASGLQLDVQPAVDDTLYTLGVAAIGDVAATRIRTLRAVGRRELWRHVANITAAYHQFTADGASYALQQVHQQAVGRLGAAEAECAGLGVGDGAYAVQIDTLSFNAQDPYGYIAPEDR